MGQKTKPEETKIQRIANMICTAKEAKEILGIRNNKTFWNRAKKGLFGESAYIGGYFFCFLRENIMLVKGNPDYFAKPKVSLTAEESKKKMSDWIESVIYN